MGGDKPNDYWDPVGDKAESHESKGDPKNAGFNNEGPSVGGEGMGKTTNVDAGQGAGDGAWNDRDGGNAFKP